MRADWGVKAVRRRNVETADDGCPAAVSERPSASRGLNVCVGQPGVEGKHGDLDGEGNGEGQKEPVLRAGGQVHLLDDVDQIETELPELGLILDRSWLTGFFYVIYGPIDLGFGLVFAWVYLRIRRGAA